LQVLLDKMDHVCNLSRNCHFFLINCNDQSLKFHKLIAVLLFKAIYQLYLLIVIVALCQPCILKKLYRKNCIQSIECRIGRRSKTAKIKCYKL